MSPIISAEAAALIRKKIDQKTRGSLPAIGGVIYSAVNAKGEVIFNHASGKRGVGVDEPMTLDTPFYMASFTKMITSIACMQLVESGQLQLDSVEQVEKLAPELRDIQVLESVDGSETKFKLIPKIRGITLRMLLTHTAGFAYAFDTVKLASWAHPIGLDDFSGDRDDVLSRPLINQPGTAFRYGTNMDWAGVLVERIAGVSLEEYFKKNIFVPLEIKNISFFPNEDQKARLAYMHRRHPDGTLEIIDHLYRAPLLLKPGDGKSRYCMAGAGCFGVPAEYLRLIATLLNDGTYLPLGAQILKPETVREMFTDQIPDKPRYANESEPVAKPLIANVCPIFPTPDDLTEGWGLSFSISHTRSSTGRAAGSGNWEGVANLYWFADRENKIGALIASQILPYGDKEVITLFEDVETDIYTALGKN